MGVNKFSGFYRSFNRKWQTFLIPGMMTGALLTFSFAVNAVDLSGEWLGEGYKCGFKTSQERVTIEQKGNSVEATKITGDKCVPAGTRTFVGTLNGEKIQATWTTGTANKPACCQKKGHLIIVDDNTLKSSVGVTYKRVAPKTEQSASISGGNDVIKRKLPDTRTNFYLVDTNKPFNAAGEVTKWQVWSENILPVKLVIYRKAGNAWSVVGMSQAKTPKKGINQFTLASPIKVQTGDFVGLYYPKAGCVSFQKDSGAWDLGNLKGTVLFTSSGAKATAFSGSSYRTYSVKVEGITDNQPQKTDLNDGLVAHYLFDGNAKDVSGNNNHGTAAGGVSYADGKMGQAAQFDGKSGVVTATLPKVKKTYSVSMFVKLNSNNKVENQLFYLTRKNAKDRLGYLSTYPVGKKTWHFGSRRYGKGWEDRGTTVVDSEEMQINKWYHLVFVLNNKDISLYANGKLLKTIKSVHNSDIEANGNLLFLVGGTTEKYQWMDGLIDDVRIYNRALSVDEIKTLSQGQVTTKPEPTEAKPTFSCEPKKTCGKMASCEEAKYHLEQCGNKRLDRDHDGIPCESLCVKK
ncbi:conserved hypothetical protein, secreted [Beggiatoa sp. PS]|nr:conserved hypothetical protein, secreted [Beggiatoa sp. PS]